MPGISVVFASSRERQKELIATNWGEGVNLSQQRKLTIGMNDQGQQGVLGILMSSHQDWMPFQEEKCFSWTFLAQCSSSDYVTTWSLWAVKSVNGMGSGWCPSLFIQLIRIVEAGCTMLPVYNFNVPQKCVVISVSVEQVANVVLYSSDYYSKVVATEEAPWVSQHCFPFLALLSLLLSIPLITFTPEKRDSLVVWREFPNVILPFCK